MLSSIEASTHFAPLARTDAVLICVPTPLTPNREPDLGPLIAAGEALGHVIQRGQLVVLESTTYPGTTREQLVPLLEHRGLRVGDGPQRRVLPRARRPGPHRLHDAQHARRWSAGSRPSAPSAPSRSTSGCATT